MRKIPKKICQSVDESVKTYHKFQAKSSTRIKDLDYLMKQCKIGNLFKVPHKLHVRMEDTNAFYCTKGEIEAGKGIEVAYHEYVASESECDLDDQLFENMSLDEIDEENYQKYLDSSSNVSHKSFKEINAYTRNYFKALKAQSKKNSSGEIP